MTKETYSISTGCSNNRGGECGKDRTWATCAAQLAGPTRLCDRLPAWPTLGRGGWSGGGPSIVGMGMRGWTSFHHQVDGGIHHIIYTIYNSYHIYDIRQCGWSSLSRHRMGGRFFHHELDCGRCTYILHIRVACVLFDLICYVFICFDII